MPFARRFDGARLFGERLESLGHLGRRGVLAGFAAWLFFPQASTAAPDKPPVVIGFGASLIGIA